MAPEVAERMAAVQAEAWANPSSLHGFGLAAAEQLLDAGVTAIFASNDQQAIGALTWAQARGICVPNELSIIGLDDIDAASVTHPPLTTLHRSQREYV